MKENKKKSVGFAEQDIVHEYETENKMHHHRNPRGMTHEDKSKRFVFEKGGIKHGTSDKNTKPKKSALKTDAAKTVKTLDPDIALEKFMTNFIRESSIKYVDCYLNSTKTVNLTKTEDLNQEFKNILEREFKKLSDTNRADIEPFRKQMEANMAKHINEMKKNLTPKIKLNLKQQDKYFSFHKSIKKKEAKPDPQVIKNTVASMMISKIYPDNKVYKSKSASLYKKLSQLCTMFGINEKADQFMKKSQEIKLEVMKTTLLSNEIQSSGAATDSSGKALKQNIVGGR